MKKMNEVEKFFGMKMEYSPVQDRLELRAIEAKIIASSKPEKRLRAKAVVLARRLMWGTK